MTIETGPDRGPVLLPICWTLTSLSTIMVALRWHCRINYQARLWWDDYFMTAALVFVWAQSITWTVYSHLGGTSYAPMSEQNVVTTGLLSWMSQAWSMAALVFGKMAVSALILRLQSPTRWRTILLTVLCSIAVVWDTIEIILIFVQCSPTQALWDSRVPGKCWNPKIVTYNGIAVAAYLAFMDLALAVIPVHMIWGLKMPLKRKIGLCFLLSTGVFAFSMAVLKADMIPADLNRNTDFVRMAVLLSIFNSCEANAVIIAGCVPTIMSLFDKLRGRNTYPSTGRTGLVYSKSQGLGGSGTRQTARNQSYQLSGKGTENTSSSFDSDDPSDNYHFVTATSNRDHDVEAGPTIQVTRQFHVADQKTSKLVQANMGPIQVTTKNGKA